MPSCPSFGILGFQIEDRKIISGPASAGTEPSTGERESERGGWSRSETDTDRHTNEVSGGCSEKDRDVKCAEAG